MKKNVIGVALLLVAPLVLSAEEEGAGGEAGQSGVMVEELQVLGSRLSDDSYRVEEMGAASKFGLSSMETPQSVTAMTRAQMDDFSLLNVNNALENVAGVSVEEVETDRTYYTSRGFDITNFQVDGLGMPLASGNTHGDLDAAIYDRIEVVRGANGLMAGAGNPSATINLVRKRPTSDFQASFATMAGSWHNFRSELDLSGNLGNERVRGRLVFVDQNKESYLDRYAQDKKVVYGIVEADITRSTQLTVAHSYQKSNADSPMWGALTLYNTDGSLNEYDVSTSSSSDWSYWNAKTGRSYLELSQALGGGWTLKAAYTHVDVEEDSELFYVYSTHLVSTPPGQVMLTGYASEYLLDEQHDLLDIYAVGPFTLLGREHELVVGGKWSKVQLDDQSLYDYQNGFPSINNLHDWDGKTDAMVFDDGLSGSDYTDRQNALYSAVRLNLADPLRVILGARVSDWESKGVAYGDSKERSDSNIVTPYIGGVFNFTPELMSYASYTESFRPQTEEDASGDRLEPVEGQSTEIGLKSALFEERLVASLALFSIQQVNLAQSAGFDTTLGRQVYTEGTGITSRGYEVELSGQISEGWSLYAGYTNLNLDAGAADENVERYTPTSLFKLSSSYRFASIPQLKVGVSVNWQDDISRRSDTVDSVTDPNNPVVIASDVEVEQKAYALVDVMASYQVNDVLSFRFNANNVTNEKYLNSLYWDQAYYGAPRHYKLTMRFDI